MASVVGSLAWPVVTLVLFLTFRASIVSLISALHARMGKLKRFKAPGGVEAEWFEDTIENAEGTVEDLPLHSSSIGGDRSNPISADDITLELAKIDPAAAVVAAFIQVERAATHFLEALGEPASRNPLVALKKSTRIDPSLKNLVLNLRELRNAAAHHGGIDISFDAAQRYIATASAATEELELSALAARDDEF